MMYSNYTYDAWLQEQIDRYNGDIELAFDNEEELLDYYEESGLMKEYCGEIQAENDEMLLWQ